MSELFEKLYSSEEYLRLKGEIEGESKCIGVSGVPECSKAHILAALYRDTGKKVCVICQNEPMAAAMQKIEFLYWSFLKI